MINKPRNPAARSPLMRKGGVHQPCRSSERQKEQQMIEQGLDVWADEIHPPTQPSHDEK